MAFEAPSHGQREDLRYSVHRLNSPMTPLAFEAREHVLAVVEVHEVGKLVHADPGNRTALENRLFELFNLNRLCLQNAVTIHTHTLSRYACVSAFPRAKVAV